MKRRSSMSSLDVWNHPLFLAVFPSVSVGREALETSKFNVFITKTSEPGGNTLLGQFPPNVMHLRHSVTALIILILPSLPKNYRPFVLYIYVVVAHCCTNFARQSWQIWHCESQRSDWKARAAGGCLRTVSLLPLIFWIFLSAPLDHGMSETSSLYRGEPRSICAFLLTPAMEKTDHFARLSNFQRGLNG